MLASLVDNFERVMAEAPNPQKKDLLRRLVKKVLVHDRRTIEVWYGLPNCRGVEDWNNWLLNSNNGYFTQWRHWQSDCFGMAYSSRICRHLRSGRFAHGGRGHA